jgi:outer membrane protein TolC
MRYLKYIFVPIICFILFLAELCPAAEAVAPGSVLTLDRAVRIALENHPGIIAAKGNVDASRSRVGEAKSAYYPQLNFAAGYNRSDPAQQASSRTLTTTGPFNSYTGTFTASQNIYDFGRTSSQVGVQAYQLESSRSDLESTAEQVVFRVKQTYYALLQSQRNQAVAAETIGQFQAHLDQARAFYEVGTKPKIDVTKAEVDLSNARLNFIRAENAVRIARVNLNNAMGVSSVPEYTVQEDAVIQPREAELAEALNRAYQTRPDLQSLIARKNAAEESVRLAKSAYYPFLTGNANFGWAGDEAPLDRGWAVGAAINFPIFSGFLTRYQVEEARANLGVFKANEESLRQSIKLEVEQAVLNIREARERIATAEITVRQGAENLELARGRYAAGVGSPIEVTDALVIYSNAKTSLNQAVYDYKTAEADLERAMGLPAGLK